MQEQLRLKQAECDQLEHRHACTVRSYNTTVHNIDAFAAQRIAQVCSLRLANDRAKLTWE